MIKQVFAVENYWKVIVYYDLDYDLFPVIEKDMEIMGANGSYIEELYSMMYSGKAKAVTYSGLLEHISLVVFNKHQSREDYINSIVHEAEHVKQAMLQAYDVEDRGEPPAYTIGYLISQMYQVFHYLICNCRDS